MASSTMYLTPHAPILRCVAITGVAGAERWRRLCASVNLSA